VGKYPAEPTSKFECRKYRYPQAYPQNFCLKRESNHRPKLALIRKRHPLAAATGTGRLALPRRLVKPLGPTRMRRKECAALRADSIIVPLSVTRNGRDHHLPLARLTTCLITEHVRTSNGSLLFPAARKRSSRGSPASFNDSSKGKSVSDTLSGVSDWSLHDLGRSFATRVAELETDVLPLNYSPKALIPRSFRRSAKVLSL